MDKKRKSNWRVWLAIVGFLAVLFRFEGAYGGPEFYGLLATSVIVWYLIGWAIDAFRERRWKNKS